MRIARHGRQAAALGAVVLGAAGCDVRIGAASYLWSLWILPALVAFYVYSFRTRRKLLERFVSTAMVPRLAAGLSIPRQVIKTVLVVVGCAAAIFALAQPRWGFTWEDVHRQGVDIVVALDVSDSMLVQDAQATGKLSRLERAKREITDLLRLMDGDRIGLVAFAGTAFIQCPLTLDYSAAQIFLDDVDTDIIPVKGTALGDAIRTAMHALKGTDHSSQAIILITDGEDHAGEAVAAAEEAKLAGIRIFAIGIGRDEGAPIPAPGGGFHRDSRGNLVMSKLDEPTLQKIAVTTGGRYVRSMSGDVDLEAVYRQGIKGSLQTQDLGSKRRQRWEERFQWILAIAVLALGAEALIPERVQRRAKKTAAVLVAALLPLMFGAAARAQAPGGAAASAPQPPAGANAAAGQGAGPGAGGAGTSGLPAPGTLKKPGTRVVYHDPGEAYRAGAYDQALQGFVDMQVDRPDDPAIMLNIGSAHYKLKDYAEARKAFEQAAVAGTPQQRTKALYNLGDTAYRQGKLDEAIAYYQATLESNPNHDHAKRNIEFVRDEIRRRHEQAKKQQDKQQEQQQQQQQQQQQNNQDPQDPNAAGQKGDKPDQQQQQQQQQPQEQQQGGDKDGDKDSDHDGLTDAQERQGANKTDPHNPDTDGDGKKDGEEDANKNGRVDPGESDPTKPDAAGKQGDAQQGGESQDKSGETRSGRPMSKQEAERYLESVGENRPKNRGNTSGSPSRVRGGKDW